MGRFPRGGSSPLGRMRTGWKSIVLGASQSWPSRRRRRSVARAWNRRNGPRDVFLHGLDDPRAVAGGQRTRWGSFERLTIGGEGAGRRAAPPPRPRCQAPAGTLVSISLTASLVTGRAAMLSCPLLMSSTITQVSSRTGSPMNRHERLGKLAGDLVLLLWREHVLHHSEVDNRHEASCLSMRCGPLRSELPDRVSERVRLRQTRLRSATLRAPGFRSLSRADGPLRALRAPRGVPGEGELEPRAHAFRCGLPAR